MARTTAPSLWLPGFDPDDLETPDRSNRIIKQLEAQKKSWKVRLERLVRTAVAAGRVSTATPERTRERPNGRALAGARLRGSVCGRHH